MVIVNYEQFLRGKVKEQVEQMFDKRLLKAIATQEFERLLIRLYQYCEELNIIRRRIDKLKFFTETQDLVMPKLIDSEVTRIDTKAREISTAYSLFLVNQKKFKVFSDEALYYESILSLLIKLAVDKCFNKEDCPHLTKEVNRLFRTNTFNTKACWSEYIEGVNGDESVGQRGKKRAETNFRKFRRGVCAQKSQIKPYMNNQSCYRSLMSRSPVISLWHPNSQFLEFKLAQKKKF